MGAGWEDLTQSSSRLTLGQDRRPVTTLGIAVGIFFRAPGPPYSLFRTMKVFMPSSRSKVVR